MQFDIQVWLKISAFLGGGLAIGLGAIGAAIGEGYCASQANAAISRNPSMAGDIFKSMLVGQAIAESASIFALVVALMLLFTSFPGHSFINVCALFSSGACIGFGAIGSGVGAGYPAAMACIGMARQPAVSKRLTTNMLIGAAVCQTPSIFALVISFILLYVDVSTKPPPVLAPLGPVLAAAWLLSPVVTALPANQLRQLW
jgi:F-type H+-transporting ATPase subunit c